MREKSQVTNVYLRSLYILIFFFLHFFCFIEEHMQKFLIYSVYLSTQISIPHLMTKSREETKQDDIKLIVYRYATPGIGMEL